MGFSDRRGVLSVMFMLDGDWLLLPLALAVLLWGARQADNERVARLMSGEGRQLTRCPCCLSRAAATACCRWITLPVVI